MRTPSTGVIPPRATVRIAYDPPLAADELPVLLGLAGKTTIHMDITPVTIMLSNLTGNHTPFLLAIVPQNPAVGAGLAAIFDAIRQRIGGDHGQRG